LAGGCTLTTFADSLHPAIDRTPVAKIVQIAVLRFIVF
jgi:hypothetical protein